MRWLAFMEAVGWLYPSGPKAGLQPSLRALPPANGLPSFRLLRHGLDRQRTLLTIMPGGGRPSHAPGLQPPCRPPPRVAPRPRVRRSPMSGASLPATKIRNRSPANDGFQIPSDPPGLEAPQPPYRRSRRYPPEGLTRAVLRFDCRRA